MSSPRTARLLALCLSLAACSGEAAAQSTGYDAASLLVSVRPEAQATAGRVLGDLDALPLYDLTLTLAEDLGSFELSEEITFQNTLGSPLRDLVFRVYANRGQTPPPVRFVEASCQGQPCMTGWDPSGVLTITPRAALAPGARLHVRVQLRGTLKAISPQRTNMLAQAMEGMTRVQGGSNAPQTGDYGLLAHGDGIASLTRFYPVLARREHGAWVRSEPSGLGDVAPDRLSHVRARVITAPGVLVAASGNVSATHAAPAVGGQPRQRVEVVAGLVRDFALLASPRFEAATEQVGDVELRSVYVQGDEAAGRQVLAAAAHAFRTFEARFGPYPYRRLDLVEAPLVGGAGGVEFSGLVTVASMFYRPVTGGGESGMGGLGALLAGMGGLGDFVGPMLAFVTAHEVSHQWWSGVVGSDAREHPFVDESLAQYSAALAMEARYGSERAEQEMTRQVAQNYQMMRMQGHADGRVDRAARDFPSELEYAGLVYGKGPFFYREARRAMGDEAFFSALHRYATDNAFRVATPVELRRAFTRGPRRRRVRRLFARYFLQTHGDEDLGRADQGALLGQWLGGGGGGATGNLGGLLEGLLGQLGQGQGGAPTGQLPAEAQDQADALRRAVRALEQLSEVPAAP